MGEQSKVFFEYIVELQSPFGVSHAVAGSIILAYKVLIALSVASMLANYRKLDVGLCALWVVILFFSLKAVRNIPIFAIVSYFVIALLTDACPQRMYEQFLSKVQNPRRSEGRGVSREKVRRRSD